MKSIKFIIAAIAVAITCTSCLKSNLKELKTYDGADITACYVYYRYVDTSIKDPLTGANLVKQTQLSVSKTIDTNANTVQITATLPANFPAAEKSKISANQLVVAFNLSTAAVIAPTGDSPALGTPADWSKSHKYVVTAANGTTKEWTVSLTLNK